MLTTSIKINSLKRNSNIRRRIFRRFSNTNNKFLINIICISTFNSSLRPFPSTLYIFYCNIRCIIYFLKSIYMTTLVIFIISKNNNFFYTRNKPNNLSLKTIIRNCFNKAIIICNSCTIFSNLDIFSKYHTTIRYIMRTFIQIKRFNYIHIFLSSGSKSTIIKEIIPTSIIFTNLNLNRSSSSTLKTIPLMKWINNLIRRS